MEDKTPEATGGVGYNELGVLVRQLHETLQELGCADAMQSMAGELPDAQDRLNYVAQLTEQAAQRVLNAVEIALPLQQKIEADAADFLAQWRNARESGEDEIRRFGERIEPFLESLAGSSRETSAQLTDILLAQDFQDLTGQVIKKITHFAQNLEHQLVDILLLSKPAADKRVGDDALLNGPVVNSAGRSDIVNKQEEVDDLLSSLGF